MASALTALESGNPDSDDEAVKVDRMKARAARFSQKLPGNRYKELEELRTKERKAFEEQGLIKVGKTELGDAVDMRGTCEGMCSEYEREFREYTREIHPFEAAPNKRMDPRKAVAAYSRSDAGAGHGDSAILPSDLRTPGTLVRTLDYLISEVMPIYPASAGGSSTPRKALGYSAGFIRDRTRAIRKEFAMQSSWGHNEAIASFERIARWHILCLRELQEESGANVDLHIDGQELGRCFTSLRQHYNDRREELGVELPCPNEPEFRAYMLIFDLTSKSVSIPCAELPSIILDDPLVKLAWEIRKSAQRNFDAQKDSSKHNAELGSNLINRFVRLLKQPNVPYLMSCLVEVRLRDMRRSALRSLMRTYPRLRGDPIRLNEAGGVVERRMVLLRTLDTILGCEEQEDEEPAYDDVFDVSRSPEDEAVAVARGFDIKVFPDTTSEPPAGALVNLGEYFNDNKDGPFVRRWKTISAKRADTSFADIVNGESGVHIDRSPASIVRPVVPAFLSSPAPAPAFSSAPAKKQVTFASPPISTPETAPPSSIFGSFNFSEPSRGASAASATHKATAAVSPVTTTTSSAFSFGTPATASPQPSTPVIAVAPKANQAAIAPLFNFAAPAKPNDIPAIPPLFSKPGLFATPPPATASKVIVSQLSTHLAPEAQAIAQAITFSTQPTEISTVVSPPRRQRKASLAISTRQTTTPLPDAEHRARLLTLPYLCDRIIDEAIASVLEQITPDIIKILKQEAAAKSYARAKLQRQEGIKQLSKWVFDVFKDEYLPSIASEAIAEEYNRRRMGRKMIRRWKRWVESVKGEREFARLEREETFRKLQQMGLGGSPVVTMADEEDPAMLLSSVRVLRNHQPDELEVDVELRQAALSTDHLFAPSTFLHIIARHVAPLLASAFTPVTARFDLSESPRPTSFSILLSSSKHSATPSSNEAARWLQSKLEPSDPGERYWQDGIEFSSNVTDRNGEVEHSEYWGLFIFEAPLQSWDSGKKAQNREDAHDRLGTLAEIADRMDNHFAPALLILSWKGESLEEVLERLDIQDSLTPFTQVAAMSLEESDQLDVRFERTVADLLPEITVKQQVVIRLDGVVRRIVPAWQRLLDTVTLVLSQHPAGGDLALEIFKAGIESINKLPDVSKSSLGKVKISKESTFEPVVLPAFTCGSTSTVIDAVDGIMQYLNQDAFNELTDVHLVEAPLRYAAQQSNPLPIPRVLQSLAYLVFGELSTQIMPLQSFWTGDTPRQIVVGYLDKVSEQYSAYIDERIRGITTLLPPSPKKIEQVHQISPNSTPTKKRSRESDTGFGTGSRETPKESKAAKNARLLKVMSEVGMSLEGSEMSGGERGWASGVM